MNRANDDAEIEESSLKIACSVVDGHFFRAHFWQDGY